MEILFHVKFVGLILKEYKAIWFDCISTMNVYVYQNIFVWDAVAIELWLIGFIVQNELFEKALLAFILFMFLTAVASEIYPFSLQ